MSSDTVDHFKYWPTKRFITKYVMAYQITTAIKPTIR